MKDLKFAIVVILIYSCAPDKYNNSEDLCQILSDLYEDDQKYRGMDGQLVDPFFKILDSIRLSEGLTKDIYMKLSEQQQLAYGKKARKIANKINVKPQSQKDSLMNLQKKLDVKNTEELLNIVKIKGFPNTKKLECKGYSAPFLIFVHSPEKYWSQIKNIIRKEREKDRISAGDFEYITWHLNGRKGHPLSPISNEDVQVIED